MDQEEEETIGKSLILIFRTEHVKYFLLISFTNGLSTTNATTPIA